MIPVILRPAANADIEDIFDWYEEQRPGLGDEFFAEVLATFKTISAHPTGFQLLKRNTRRALLHRFPYAIYFRVRQEFILVVACIHGRRNPRHWKSRN
jgi:plasmid stabilization system protein ParE